MRPHALAGALALCLAATGCGPAPDSAHHPPLILATIHPLGALASEIAGSNAEVSVLLPAGGSPHGFDPSPGMLVEAARATVFLRVGKGMDDWSAGVSREARRAGATEIVLLDEIDPGQLLPVESGQGINPHVWLDPTLLLGFCRKLGAVLAEKEPARAALWRARADACADSLVELDGQLREILRDAAGEPFLATHSAWSYFVRRYGLRQLDVVHRSVNREPGPRFLSDLLTRAEADSVQAVFTEFQLSEASARTVADELGVPVVKLDPLGDPAVPERRRYFDLLRWDARRMAAALSPGRQR
jgi:zinc transport system substrate-binding protein